MSVRRGTVRACCVLCQQENSVGSFRSRDREPVILHSKNEKRILEESGRSVALT